MKNKAVNGLVSVILGAISIGISIYVAIGLTIYGLWLSGEVLKDKENSPKWKRIIAILVRIIGIPIIILSFILFFKSIV